LTSYLI